MRERARAVIPYKRKAMTARDAAYARLWMATTLKNKEQKVAVAYMVPITLNLPKSNITLDYQTVFVWIN